LRIALRPEQILVGIFVFAATCSIGYAGNTDNCRDATDRYNQVVFELARAIRQYSRCVMEGKGHDDCLIEFRHVAVTQENFVRAVSNYGSECQ
jgi:hypothetical protein